MHHARRAGRLISIALAGDAPGAGRTTLAINLAAALTRLRLRVAIFASEAIEVPAGVELVRPGGRQGLLACDVALLDLTVGEHAAELADADEVLVVLRPTDDPSAMERALSQARPAWRRAPARYVINQLDARRESDRLGLRSLRARLGARLLEPPVQRDPGGPLFAPDSQAAVDVAALAGALGIRRRRDAR